jgi:hypothetical protein
MVQGGNFAYGLQLYQNRLFNQKINPADPDMFIPVKQRQLSFRSKASPLSRNSMAKHR